MRYSRDDRPQGSNLLVFRPPTPAPDAARHAALRADVEARLRNVCAQLSPERFDQLVADIVAMKLRWEAFDETRAYR